MNAIILRSHEPKQTRGNMIIYDGADILFSMKSLELPDKGNAKNVSCIPAGVYDCELIKRGDGTQAYWVKNVPGRSEILIHSGNYAWGNKVDTQGCILCGLRFSDLNTDGTLDISDSVIAMQILIKVMGPKFKLTII